MRVVAQRVKKASVAIEKKEFSCIKQGLLLLVAIGKHDTAKDLEYTAGKIKNIRVFDDEKQKINLNITQINGEILSVPQFTLYADTRKGNRPGFEKAAPAESAKELWKAFNNQLEKEGLKVKTGKFGAIMDVELINDGPVTILLDSEKY